MDPLPSFPERQKELCILSSFISDQEQWLQNLLNRLDWSKESLDQQEQEESLMVQCPFNENHYVPQSSLKKHTEKCQYAVHGVGPELMEEMVYSSQPDLTINSAVVSGVKKYAKTTGATTDAVSHDSLVSREQFASLEDSSPAPPESTTWKPPQTISYIKSWTMVPSDFVSLSRASINQAQTKGWLFKNLPSTHAHSYRLGGEMTTVESIMAVLESDPDQNISPDYLTKKLRSSLGQKSRQFVLDLWKFIHISRVQLEHSISDNLLEDIAPMPVSLLHPSKDKKDENPVISEIIETIAAEGVGPSHEPTLPLPMDHVFYKWTPAERRVMYDYVVQKTSLQSGPSKLEDPDLYRDDIAAIKAKLKIASRGEGEEGLSHLEILKRKRDYKRRRQSYRAKNVHITQRTTAEVFRAIINNRMEELSAAATLTVPEEPTNAHETTYVSTGKSPTRRRHSSNRDGSPDYRTRTQSPGYRRHSSRHSERDTVRSSRRDYDRSQSHSHHEERHRHNETDKSEVLRKSPDTSVTRSRYKGRERSPKYHSRSKDRSRSRSHSRDRKHRKHHHKKQSRSHSRDRP